MSYTTDADGELFRRLFMANGGSQPVLDGINHFYRYGISKILSAYNIRTSDGKVGMFSNIMLTKPTINDLKANGRSRPLMPYEARRNNLSYMAQLYSSIQLHYEVDGELRPIPGESDIFYWGKIPAILHSEACHLYGLTPQERYEKGEPEHDPGAYAIIKGAEKILLNIQNLRDSDFFLYDDKGEFIMRYTSQLLTETTINVIKEEQRNINMSFSGMGITNSINIFYIFYVFGISDDTINKVFDLIDNFIVDEDPERQTRRRREMRYYLQPTANTFIGQTHGTSQQVYSRLADKIHNKNIIISQHRDIFIQDFIWREVFKNLTLGYNSVYEFNPQTHQEGLLNVLSSKSRMLAHMVAMYVDFKNGFRNVDDRDDWGNKKLTDLNAHVTKRFHTIWKSIISTIQGKIDTNNLRTVGQIKKAVNQNYMTEQFINSYSKELWGSNRGQRDVVVVDTLKRDNLLAAISHIRRISTPTNRRAKIRDKRLLNLTSWAVICPAMTPEGEACGLNSDSAITTYISLDRDSSIVKSRLSGRTLIPGSKLLTIDTGIVIQTVDGERYPAPAGSIDSKNGVVMINEAKYSLVPTNDHLNPLYLNGENLGYCNSRLLLDEMRNLRRSGQLYFDMGIILDQYNVLKLYTNQGRVCRPLLLVDESSQELLIDIKDLRGADIDTLMREGVLEYIDIAEQEQIYMLIAESNRHLRIQREQLETSTRLYNELIVDPDATRIEIESTISALNSIRSMKPYTHCEVDPTAIFGLSAISMPFPEFNPGPRVTYQSGMSRQALGGNSSRVELRFDTTVKTIMEPGLPTVTTDAHEFLGLRDYPSGHQLVIAITTYGGSNQEDAITFNKTPIDLGLFKMVIYYSYKTTRCQGKDHQEFIRVPNYSINQSERYSKLDPQTGIVRVGEYVETDDCLVGKVVVYNTGEIKNASLFVEVGKRGIVDEVYTTENAEGCQLIRVRLREVRDLQPGDKLASRYAQKGIIGAILHESEMPWVISDNPLLNGVRPHIIFNPHGIPSRMTMGKLYEIQLGILQAILGERANATAFRRFDINTYMNELERFGFNRSGKVKMVNGLTGRIMDADIMVGTVHYQLLRHLVEDKMQARGTGRIHFLNRQPIAGIRKQGGLRFGEMERDSILEYGAASLQEERMLISSDAYQATICKECKTFAYINVELGIPKCRRCNPGAFTRVTIPYPFKLMINYLAAANMRVKIHTKDK